MRQMTFEDFLNDFFDGAIETEGLKREKAKKKQVREDILKSVKFGDKSNIIKQLDTVYNKALEEKDFNSAIKAINLKLMYKLY